MPSTLVRRTVVTASAVSLALLATACGSDKADDKKADAKPSAAASSAAPAAKGKTDAELAALLVTQAELPTHAVRAATPAELAAAASAGTDKPECLPLAKAQSSAPVGTPVGRAGTKAVTIPKSAADVLGATVTSIALASYDGKGAEEAFAAVKAAATACAGGYTGSQAGDSLKIEKVVPGAPVTAGDEALAYTAMANVDGEKAATELVVVRKGNTIATFSAVSPSGSAEQPKAVVEIQAKKLG
ncbi:MULTISPECIES: hypothetical protein [unclassified Streptomyces]|uniref:hypothetical protein n=1 Tax=unclassified Streptomyces TaxID=2593676 RepID=UPI002E168851|nr:MULTISPECIES: hypothetical protein [unclassified Streptomyces]WSR27617.1 hypothetical protein OG573_16635 [Streptomyces sp. NBC_01205]